MKNIFPTFEEIYQGYCVYILHDYKGLDDDGNPQTYYVVSDWCREEED